MSFPEPAAVSPMHPDDNDYWRRNLAVCVFGAFSTVFSLTILLPFLPLYVQQLGVRGHAAIVLWAAVAYAAAFASAGLVAPLWGYLGDRFGRKIMLIRASLGMTIIVSLTGLTNDVVELVSLRFLAGLVGGYGSSATVLIAVQTPKAHSARALGILSAGILAGGLVGPLVGGTLPALIGIRATFFGAGALIFVAFLATLLLIRDAPRQPASGRERPKGGWSQIPNKRLVVAMLATGLLLMFANMSIEPIIAVYVATLVKTPEQTTFVAGLVLSASALGSIVSASRLGKLADRIGPSAVIVVGLSAAALLLIPQAFVTSSWQLVLLRFLMGLALGGLLPCITSILRHSVPEHIVGLVLGYSISAQFAGHVAGPLIGGLIGGHLGMRWVFVGTGALLALAAAYHWHAGRAERRPPPSLAA